MSVYIFYLNVINNKDYYITDYANCFIDGKKEINNINNINDKYLYPFIYTYDGVSETNKLNKLIFDGDNPFKKISI